MNLADQMAWCLLMIRDPLTTNPNSCAGQVAQFIVHYFLQHKVILACLLRVHHILTYFIITTHVIA